MTPDYRNPIGQFLGKTIAGIAYWVSLAYLILTPILLGLLSTFLPTISRKHKDKELRSLGEILSDVRTLFNDFRDIQVAAIIAGLVALWVTVLAIDHVGNRKPASTDDLIQVERIRFHRDMIYGLGSSVITFLALTQIVGTLTDKPLTPIILWTLTPIEALAIFATLYLRTDLWSDTHEQEYYFLKSIDQLAYLSSIFQSSSKNEPPTNGRKHCGKKYHKNALHYSLKEQKPSHSAADLLRKMVDSIFELYADHKFYFWLPVASSVINTFIILFARGVGAAAGTFSLTTFFFIVKTMSITGKDPFYRLRGSTVEGEFPWRLVNLLIQTIFLYLTVTMIYATWETLPENKFTKEALGTLLYGAVIVASLIFPILPIPPRPKHLIIEQRDQEALELIVRLRRLKEHLPNTDHTPNQLLHDRIKQFKLLPVEHKSQAALKPELQPYYLARITAPVKEGEVPLEQHLLLFTQYLDPRLTTLDSLLEEPPEGPEDNSEASSKEPVA